MSGFTKVLNDFAPHTVIPKVMAGFQAGLPQLPAAGQTANGGEPMAAGAGLSGIRERRAVRDGDLSAMEARQAEDRESTLKSGFSMTGDTIFM